MVIVRLLSNMSLYSLRIAVANIQNNADVAKRFWKINAISPINKGNSSVDHGVGSTDHFSALKIWMFENKFVSLPSHLKTIEPMARPIRKKSGTGVYQMIRRTDPMIPSR